MKKNSWHIRVWKNGSYLDLWSVNHFLAGVLLGGLALFNGVEFWTGLIVAVVLMIGWELFEIIRHIEETIGNRFSDLFLGIVGFLLLYLLGARHLSLKELEMVFFGVLIVWIILELWGYYAYNHMENKGVR